jgi:hypothetical protein
MACSGTDLLYFYCKLINYEVFFTLYLAYLFYPSYSQRVLSTVFEICRHGGVVVSVLATGPKVAGSKPGQGDGLLRAIKIRSAPSSRMGRKAGRSHVLRFYGM